MLELFLPIQILKLHCILSQPHLIAFWRQGLSPGWP